MSHASLSFTDVGFTYPGSEADPALSGVTLEAESGKVHWFTGPLGAGCTTLLMTAAGLAPRYTGGELTGSIRLLGVDPHGADAPRALAGRVAFVTATPALQLSGIAETVLEEVSFAPANLGWPIARITAAARAALDAMGAGELAERDPRALSGGETQRVVIAAMLALSPDVWFLDEAGSALDPMGRELLAEVMRSERRRGALVIVASEDMDVMAQVADQVYVLGGGRIVAQEEPAALLRSARPWSLGIGSTGAAELARAADAAAPSELLRPPYPLTVEEAIIRWSR